MVFCRCSARQNEHSITPIVLECMSGSPWRSSQMETGADGVSNTGTSLSDFRFSLFAWFPEDFTHFSFSVKLKSTRTETITSTMRQTVAFGFMFTYCDAPGGWVAIGTFVATHPSEKVPILCNTRYFLKNEIRTRDPKDPLHLHHLIE